MANSEYHIVDLLKESNRLYALAALNVLDTAPEPYYDKITRIVSLKFGAPVALVSLVDKGRLFFKSTYGTQASEVDRANTFCTVAITDSDVLVVQDALQDKRFQQCPIVVNSPYARFYAGAPIILSSGICIGTVCFVYLEPYYDFSEEDKIFLQDMADMAASHFDLRLSRELIDPMNLLPMSSVAISVINDLAYLKGLSISAYSIELFGSVRISELLVTLDEQKVFTLLQTERIIINNILPKRSSHMFSLGMDRFLCIVGGLLYEESLTLVKEIEEALSKVIDLEDMPIINLPKIGLAYSDSNNIQPGGLIRMSIAAMDDSRKHTRSSALYSEDGENKIKRRLNIIHDFPGSLASGEFSIQYQPKINLTNNKVVGAEALIRWEHKTLGRIGPDEFIPLIEDTCFIYRLSEWLIERVIFDLDEWEKRGIDLNISINMSAMDFQNEAWVDKLKQNNALLEKAKNICFELTETAAFSNVQCVCETIDRLNEIGIKTHIDDFGTGHSTLTYVSMLNVSALKLDQQFVMPMVNSTKDKLIVEYTCHLAKALGFELIAEGVETEDVKAILKKFGVDYAQGYLFAEPMDVDIFNKWLMNRTSECG